MRQHIAVEEELAQRVRRLSTLGEVERTPMGLEVQLVVRVGNGLALGSKGPSIDAVVDSIEQQVHALRAVLPAVALAAYDGFDLSGEEA